MAENTNNEKQIKDPPASFHSKVWTHFGLYETDDGRTLVRPLSTVWREPWTAWTH